MAAFPACTAGARAVLPIPCRFLSDFYLLFHTRKDHYASETFWKLKESETIKRFAAVRASGGGKCYPSPGADAEGLKTGIRPPGPPGDRLSAGAGWGTWPPEEHCRQTACLDHLL